MVDISNFTINSKAEEEGAWVQPGEEYDDLEIKTRGYTHAYRDALNAKMRKAAVGFNGDQAKVPSAIQQAHMVECIIKHCLQDVRGISSGGVPITFDAFCDLIREPAYRDLLTASLKAIGQVGIAGKTDAEDAAGN